MNKAKNHKPFRSTVTLTLLVTVFAGISLMWLGRTHAPGAQSQPVSDTVPALSVHDEMEVVAEPVPINSADAQLFQQLKGIGEQLSQRIVAYRDEHGPFRSVEDLAQVKGISLKMVERNRDRLRLEE